MPIMIRSSVSGRRRAQVGEELFDLAADQRNRVDVQIAMAGHADDEG